MSYLKNDFNSLFNKNLDGEERRKIWNRLYLKICILLCGSNYSKIALFSGYSTVSVTTSIKRDNELRNLFNSQLSGFSSNILISKYSGNVENAMKQMMENHIKRTKKDFNSFNRYTEKEKEKILKRIRSLYE